MSAVAEQAHPSLAEGRKGGALAPTAAHPHVVDRVRSATKRPDEGLYPFNGFPLHTNSKLIHHNHHDATLLTT